MIHENEILMFTLGIGIYLFTTHNKSRLKRIPASRMLLLSYQLLLPAWALTILEGFFLPRLFNFFEHLFYVLSVLILVVWCWKISLGNQQGAK